MYAWDLKYIFLLVIASSRACLFIKLCNYMKKKRNL